MPYKKITGIYKIENSINHKKYIGSGVSIKQRFYNHKKALNENKHFNTHLQASWNKYGAESFIFSIIELCEKEQLQEKEEYYITKLNSKDRKFGYNKRVDCRTNLGIKFSEDIKKRLRLSHLGKKRSKKAHKKIISSQHKPVCQIDKKGKLVKTFKSMLEAELKTGIPRQAISGCCRKISISAKGYFWCYKKELKNFKIKNDNRALGKIIQLTKDDNFIKEWESANIAAKVLNIKQGNICLAVKKIRKTAGGYKWKLKH